MKDCGDFFMLYNQESNKYAGILKLPALCSLVKNHTIHLNAALHAPETRSRQESKSAKGKKPKSAQKCSIRIVIYGLNKEKSAVSKLLSEAELFLQHPSAAEYNRLFTYSNPHYLLRPGSQMPDLGELSLDSPLRGTAQADVLEEVNKSRFMRIFDSADGKGIPLNVGTSPRLSSALME
jgi:hypothetical protein